MKTYVEASGIAPFNWREYLLKQKSIFLQGKDLIQWKNARELARSYVTCACGNQCASLPRGPMGAPTDLELSTLGSNFYDHVRNRNWQGALKTLDLIEERSKFLLNHPELQTPYIPCKV